MILPKDPVGGLVAHFDLASAAPGRDQASRWAGLRAEGRLRFTPWGVAFGEGGALSAEGYTGPRLSAFALCVWVRHDGGKRSALGAPLWLEALHTDADDEARRQAGRSGTPQAPWGEGIEFRSTRAGLATLRPADPDAATGLEHHLDATEQQWGGHQLYVVNYDGAHSRRPVWPSRSTDDMAGARPTRAFEPGQTKLWIGPLGESAGSGDLSGLTVAEVRIYDRALTAEELGRLHDDFDHRRRLRARTVAGSLPRFAAIHALRDDNTYAAGVWVGAWQHVRIDPLETGQVTISQITDRGNDFHGDAIVFHHLGVGQQGQLTPGSPTDVLPHERFHVVQAHSGQLIFASHDWSRLLTTAAGSGVTESKQVLTTQEFSLYDWPELQVWGSAGGVRAAVDLQAPKSEAMLPLGWFHDARRKDKALQPDGPVAARRDASGLVDGAYRRFLPDVPPPAEGITVLVWVRVEPEAPVGGGSRSKVFQLMLGARGAFFLTLNLESRAGAEGREHCFSVYTERMGPTPLQPVTKVDHTMQLVAIWVDREQALLGVRAGAGAADSVVPLPAGDVAALARTDVRGGALDLQARAGEWTLAAVEVHAGRLPDTDLALRNLVMRHRVYERQVAAEVRLPDTFALYAPKTGQYLSWAAAPATGLSTTSDLRQAAVWRKDDFTGSSMTLIRALDREQWLLPGAADSATPGVAAAAPKLAFLRMITLPDGRLAFQDMQNLWLRVPDTPGPAKVGREVFFPPVLGDDHEIGRAHV